MATKKTFCPFDFYTKEIIRLLVEAKKSSNPALFLHENSARNVLFMLEGLTRIHKEIITDKKMEKWYDRFKLLEDILGQIDHVDVNAKELTKKKLIDKNTTTTLQKEVDAKIQMLNALIGEKKWLITDFVKFEKFIQSLALKYDTSFIEKLTTAYKKEIKEITEFAVSINGNYTKIEEEVHEMRRKLRWLSIYAQSLQGVFQLNKPKTQPLWSKKYMKKSIIESPYNKMPKSAKDIPTIQLDYYCFIALSFIINALGTVKDQGLMSHLLKEKLGKSSIQLKKLLGNLFVEDADLLKKASLLCNPFFKEKVLEKLVK